MQLYPACLARSLLVLALHLTLDTSAKSLYEAKLAWPGRRWEQKTVREAGRFKPDLIAPLAQKGGAAGPRYYHPKACFGCRRSFKRASREAAVLPCPHCGRPAIGLTRKFKPPPKTDVAQWKKVQARVSHGFLFWSLGEPYPETLMEADAFAARHADFVRREREAYPDAFVEIDAALNRLGTSGAAAKEK